MMVKADQIKQALAKKHTDDFFMTEVTLYSESKNYRMDAMAMAKSWTNPCLYGYEIKVSRSDFISDKKWPNYLGSCNTFAFVCPKGLITKDELDEGVGLYWYYPESGKIIAQRQPKYRHIDIPAKMYQYIIMSKLNSDRHPFYSSSREYFEAWIADKAERNSLANHVSGKLQTEMIELRTGAKSMERIRERYESDHKLLQQVIAVLREKGLSINSWSDSWQDELRQALAGGLNPNASRILKRLTDNAEELKRVLGEVIET